MSFPEQDVLEGGLVLVGDLSDMDSLQCRRTQDFRTDKEVSFLEDDPDAREERVKRHKRRIQRELRNARS